MGVFHQIGENLVALPRDFGDQILAPGEVAVDSGGGNAGGFGGLGQGPALGAFLLDQPDGRIDERLAQVAMVVSAFLVWHARALNRPQRAARSPARLPHRYRAHRPSPCHVRHRERP